MKLLKNIFFYKKISRKQEVGYYFFCEGWEFYDITTPDIKFQGHQ